MGNKAKLIIEILKQEFANQKTITLFELRQLTNPLIQEFIDYISKNVYFNYSSKMWGKKFEDIDPNTINRVKIVLGYDHNYFPDDKYQGLPNEGYTEMIKKMLSHPNIHVNLNTDALTLIKFEDKIWFKNKELECPLVYCGPLDEALNNKYGMLPYRSLNIKFETINQKQFQQTAVINYPADPKMTRIAEYKLMTLQNADNVTTISKEYPGAFSSNSKEFGVRYYPIICKDSVALYEQYANFFKKYKNFYPLGRLSQYKYFDMDDAIEQALTLAKGLQHA